MQNASTDDLKRADSAGVKFKKSLQELIEALSRCRPSYVRCIKPNEGKRSLFAEEERFRHQVGGSEKISYPTPLILWSPPPARFGIWDFWKTFEFVEQDFVIVRRMTSFFYATSARSLVIAPPPLGHSGAVLLAMVCK